MLLIEPAEDRAPRRGREIWEIRLKRAFDLIFGSLVLLAISPLIALIALAVLVSDGLPNALNRIVRYNTVQ